MPLINSNNINLQSILDLSSQLNDTKDIKSIYNLSLLSIIGKVGITKAQAYLYEKGKFNLKLSKGLKLDSKSQSILNDIFNYIPRHETDNLNLNNDFFVNDFNSNNIQIENIFDVHSKDNHTITNTEFLHNNFNIRVLRLNSIQIQSVYFNFIVPLYYAESLIGIICLGPKLKNDNLTFEEIQYINLISNITSAALQNTKNYLSLLRQKNKSEKRNQLLQTLFEISKDFGFFTSQENILKNFSLSLMGQLQLTKFMLVCLDSNWIDDEIIYTPYIKLNKLSKIENIDFLKKLANFKRTIDLQFFYQNYEIILDYLEKNLKEKNLKDNNLEEKNLNKLRNEEVQNEVQIEEVPYQFLQELNLPHTQEQMRILELINFDSEFLKFLISNNVQFIVPLYVQGVQKGAVLLGKKLTTKFTTEEIRFVESLGNTALTAIENIRLFNEEIEKKKVDNEIKIALEIQKNLLPKSPPKIEGIDIAGITLAARVVGGDYYDYIKINEDLYFIIIADVTGKGVPASIIMANIQAAVKLLCFTDSEPAVIADKLNKLVCSNTTIDKFASVFMGFLDIKNKSLKYVNAGHNPPFVFNKRKDKFDKLSTANMLIGVLDFNTYNSKIYNFDEGDILVLYTDGVVEAQFSGEEYSEERLIQLIEEKYNYSAQEIIDIFLDEIHYTKGVTTLYDDITQIIFKF